MIVYSLPGSKSYQDALYPNPELIKPEVREKHGLKTSADVIAYFTAKSLELDGIAIEPGSLSVVAEADGYRVSFRPLPGSNAEQFAGMHRMMTNAHHFGLALKGAEACKETPLWNPMAGFPVNSSDGPSEWLPCLPVGMGIVNHRAVTLLHYPPIVAYRTADYLNNQTLRRWSRLLGCVGIPDADLGRYKTILDVNPIAAPGSGESEYPNDYFPIGLTSQFYDNERHGLTYVQSMLRLMLDPPTNDGNPLTLPLLVGGSPLYDPQAPGWFRVRYKDHLPKDQNGSPTVDVLQTGFIDIVPHKRTPYMIVNHMIAAGVTGKCTNDPSQIPNIQKYEAQDLVAATFLKLYEEARESGKPFDPAEAKRQACLRWFGADNGDGAPNPPDQDDKLTICALAQVDLCFDDVKIQPMYTLAQARERCREKGGASFSPCFGCKPLSVA